LDTIITYSNSVLAGIRHDTYRTVYTVYKWLINYTVDRLVV